MSEGRIVLVLCEVCETQHNAAEPCFTCLRANMLRPPPKKPKPLTIFMPPELEPIRADLQRFFDSMIFKLRLNSGRGRWSDIGLATCLKKLKGEVAELAAAIKEGSSAEVQMEAADVANYAMIAANVALEAKDV